MPYTCIIVEDEPLSQKVLQKYIADTPSLELKASCANAFEAQAVLQKEAVELIFLDINMPKLSGISFLKSLTRPPQVIFTTAYPDYALEGFNLDAVDYLLKPFSYERFYKAVNKAIQLLSPDLEKESPSFIILKADKKIYKINYSEIYFLEAFGDYVKVYLKDKVLVVYETLKNLGNQLAEANFTRIHKSYIISVNHIEYIDGNRLRIREQYLPISSTYKNQLLNLLRGRSN